MSVMIFFPWEAFWQSFFLLCMHEEGKTRALIHLGLFKQRKRCVVEVRNGKERIELGWPWRKLKWLLCQVEREKRKKKIGYLPLFSASFSNSFLLLLCLAAMLLPDSFFRHQNFRKHQLLRGGVRCQCYSIRGLPGLPLRPWRGRPTASKQLLPLLHEGGKKSRLAEWRNRVFETLCETNNKSFEGHRKRTLFCH